MMEMLIMMYAGGAVANATEYMRGHDYSMTWKDYAVMVPRAAMWPTHPAYDAVMWAWRKLVA